jgi:hypothetical protein
MATDIPVIEMRHVDKHYGQLHVLQDINLSIAKGEVVVLIGPSGSGKSTLCRTINRLETIDSGEILIEGEPLHQEGKQLAQMRAEIGMVFQSFNLFAHKTILENVTLGPIEVLKRDKAQAEAEALELLGRVGVREQARFPDGFLQAGVALPGVVPAVIGELLGEGPDGSEFEAELPLSRELPVEVGFRRGRLGFQFAPAHAEFPVLELDRQHHHPEHGNQRQKHSTKIVILPEKSKRPETSRLPTFRRVLKPKPTT